jgi:DNA gyrase subunit A
MGMSVIQPGVDILVLTETGYGKRVNLDEHIRPKHRGGQGVGLISLEGRKTGKVAAVALVEETDEELLLISAAGQVVRTDVKSVNRYSSSARGVIVMRLKDGDSVAGISVFREGLAAGRGMADNDDPEAGAVPSSGEVQS